MSTALFAAGFAKSQAQQTLQPSIGKAIEELWPQQNPGAGSGFGIGFAVTEYQRKLEQFWQQLKKADLPTTYLHSLGLSEQERDIVSAIAGQGQLI